MIASLFTRFQSELYVSPVPQLFLDAQASFAKNLSARPFQRASTCSLSKLIVGNSRPLRLRLTCMARQSALPPTLPPRLVGRDAAAASLSISRTMCDLLVK